MSIRPTFTALIHPCARSSYSPKIDFHAPDKAGESLTDVMEFRGVAASSKGVHTVWGGGVLGGGEGGSLGKPWTLRRGGK